MTGGLLIAFAGCLQRSIDVAGSNLRLPRHSPTTHRGGAQTVRRGRKPVDSDLVGFSISAVLLAPTAVLVSATLADANPTVLALATTMGVLATLVQFFGLIRWPFAMPHLARVIAEPSASPGTIDAVDVVFQTIEQVTG